MKLNKLSLEDKKVFSKYLNLSSHDLSAYAFESIYIWRNLFGIMWAVFENNLCVFFRDKWGCFLYLPPLGKNKNPRVLREAFGVINSFNKNKEISRIENVEENELDFYCGLGYEYRGKFGDYLCLREELAELRGSRFKHKRAAFNYFVTHYGFDYLPFDLKYREVCLRLYSRWMKGRRTQNTDPVYQGMLKDSGACLKVLLDDYASLDIIGRIVKIDNTIKGFTFGFKLNKETFCILYEITDLSVKGLSQFIFQQFCRDLKEYKYINIMDDSGLANLKKVKLSYRPLKLVPSYIVKEGPCVN